MYIYDMKKRSMQEPTFLILTALAAGPQHGYGIITDAEGISGGVARLQTGTLYMALDRLRSASWPGNGIRAPPGCRRASRDRGSPDPEPVQIAEPIEPGPEQRPPVVDVLFGSPVVRLVGGSTQRSPFA